MSSASEKSVCLVLMVCSFSFVLIQKKTEPKEKIKAASLRLLRRTSTLSGKNSLRSDGFPLFTLRSAPPLHAAELMPAFFSFLFFFLLYIWVCVLKIKTGSGLGKRQKKLVFAPTFSFGVYFGRFHSFFVPTFR